MRKTTINKRGRKAICFLQTSAEESTPGANDNNFNFEIKSLNLKFISILFEYRPLDTSI